MLCVMGALVCRVSRSGRSASADWTIIEPKSSAQFKRSSNTASERQPKPPTTLHTRPHYGCPIMPIHGGKGMAALVTPCNSLRLLHHRKHTCVSHFVQFAQFRRHGWSYMDARGLMGKVKGFMYLANMCAKVLGGLNLGMASCSERQRQYRSH